MDVSAAQEKAVQAPVHGKGYQDIQTLVMDVAPTASDAVIAITYWIDHGAPGQQELPVASGVVGTGFLVDAQGDFITAAHVAKIKEIGPAERRIESGCGSNSADSAGSAGCRRAAAL